ncbi:NnrU family protein [Congregibacter litoralis]|uniref:Putative membrane protein n=1 Tax=Congregibacter litoralis KT71 TaxID=314285 RepID=A4A3P3_9GAMM|nr:NnrU family protein [Congregibacter litoralis]EAQ99316.1 putative membrane protein [Congregibacter litoralis KT71]
MILLVAGVVLFTGTHLFLGLAPDKVSAARQGWGEGPLKGLVTVFTVAGMALIVLGWRSSDSAWLYTTPSAIRGFASALAILAIYLLVVSNRPSAVKGIVRHPQLTAVLLWAVAHLLLNGDSRSLVLFGGLALWSVLEILVINRRDGAWEKPAAAGVIAEVVTVAIAAIVVVVLVWAHPWYAGMPAVAGL